MTQKKNRQKLGPEGPNANVRQLLFGMKTSNSIDEERPNKMLRSSPEREKDSLDKLKATHSLQSETAQSPANTITRTAAEQFLYDTERGMLPGLPRSASCVQRFDDSLNSAIRITYRISLRSSSSREPRYPLLRVVSRLFFLFLICLLSKTNFVQTFVYSWGFK
jgi:hypothetical protein